MPPGELLDIDRGSDLFFDTLDVTRLHGEVFFAVYGSHSFHAVHKLKFAHRQIVLCVEGVGVDEFNGGDESLKQDLKNGIGFLKYEKHWISRF